MTLSFLYARSGQVRNRIFHVKEQLFLKRFVNENTYFKENSNVIIS